MSSDHEAVSGASLGLGGTTAASEFQGLDPRDRARFDVGDGARYEDGGLLGRGGMGEVRAVHDRRLGRLVALKITREDRPRARERVVGEAVLTARLEHPGIVPVYGAGRTAEGLPYYTMPVVRGRSLAQAVAATTDLAARLRLVRHFIDACQAVAFAHSRGVLHRDLKPANIMVGEFGETLVVDWGLAIELERAQSARPVGTRDFAAPEQIAGESVDVRADIFGLGATLEAILHGDEAPPPDLAAVVRKAKAPAPDDRYPTAAALAADVEAWFEGRRVDAYRYSTWELARRLLRTHAVPVAIAAGAVVAVAVALAVGFAQTSTERDRALLAEDQANEARVRSESNLRAALIARALDAAARDQRAQAEILAAEALVLGEHPVARGILAQFGGRPRPRMLARWELPHCRRAAVEPGTDRVVCPTSAGIALGTLADPERHLLPDVDVFHATFFGGGAGVVASTTVPDLILWDGEASRRVPADRQRFTLEIQPGTDRVFGLEGGELHVIEVDGSIRPLFACPPDGLAPRAFDVAVSGRTAMWCVGVGVGVRDAVDGGPLRWMAAYDPALGIPLEVRLSEPHADLVVTATVDHRLVVQEVATGRTVRQLHPEGGVVGDVRIRGDRLAVSSSEGDVEVWSLADGTRVARLPATGARLEWREDDVLRVIEDQAVSDWWIPAAARPHRFPSDSGLSAVDFSADGALIATAHGDGRLRVVDARDGRLVGEKRLHTSVHKDVAFSPDGTLLVSGMAESEGLRVTRLDDFSTTLLPEDKPIRRVAWWGPRTLVGAAYGPNLRAWDVTGVPKRVDPGVQSACYDLESGPMGKLVAFEKDGRIVEVDDDGAHTLGTSADGRGLARADGLVALIETRRLRLFGPGGERSFDFPGATSSDVAVSPDGRWVAVGLIDGTVAVWSADDGTIVATLRGHDARIGGLDFDGSDWLATAGWDGDVRVWSLADLRAPAVPLAAAMREAWGREVDEILLR